MARTNKRDKPIKITKLKTIRNKFKQNTKKRINDIQKQISVSEKVETNNESVLELMTKYPELNQTFEYILYSNKYKHTLTDVFNIIKMLMSKLEELQKHDVDLKNVIETVNLNYKIKGLVQSTAINLSHVVEQLNVNESQFLDFAHSFSNIPTSQKITNDGKQTTENLISSFKSVPMKSKAGEQATKNISSSITSVPTISEERIVSSLSLPTYNSNQQSLSREIKTESVINQHDNEIFGCNLTVILSSDEECEESNENDVQKKNGVSKEQPLGNDDDVENYALGSDFPNILSHNDISLPVISSPKKSKDNTTLKLLSEQKTQSVKKIKPKISDEAINKARQEDFLLRKRLNERNHEILNIVKELNLQPHDIVLEFDTVKKVPLITIQKELTRVLKKHQVEGIRFLWNTVFETVHKTNTTDGTGCILAHRMGIGKTLQIITLMYTVLCHSEMNIKTFLIICPPGIIYNWMDEIYKWLKDVDRGEIVKVYDLPKTNKLYNITNIATWKCKGGILILSYENFKSLVNCKQTDLRESFAHTLINPGPDVVILDEGHYIKNSNTVLLKSLTQIRTKRRIVLTGTPMQNSLKEYFTMVDFVKPNILGNFGDFTSTFIKPIDSGQFIDSCDNSVLIMKQRTFILHKLLENTIHRIDDRHLKPLFTKKIEYTIEVNMTEFQCELYEKFLHYNKTSNDSCVFLRLHILTLITLHPITLYRLVHYKNKPEFGTVAINEKFAKDLSWIADYENDSRFFDIKNSNKMIYLLTTIDECQKRNEKILCFLKSPLALDALEYFLEKEKNWIVGKNYFRMDGKTPLSIRNQMCEAFNNSENPAKLFVLSLGTGVLGFNMVGANRVLLLSTSWNPSNDLQAIYRCLRFGQKKTVYVNRLLAKGTVEPKAYYRQISKLGMASSVVDLQHMSRKISYDQTNDLFTFDSSKHYYPLGPNTEDPVLNQLIRCNYSSISDIKEHDSMLVESVEDQLTIDERKATWLTFKNKDLAHKTSLKPKPLKKLQNVEQQKSTNNKNCQIVNEGVKQQIDNELGGTNISFVGKRSFSSSPQNVSVNHNSNFHTNIQSPGPSSLISPTFVKNSTQFSDTAEFNNSVNPQTELRSSNLNTKRNHWQMDTSPIEPIQRQFRSFQNKSFNHHKRYHTSNIRLHAFKGIRSKNNSQQLPHNFQNQSQDTNQRTPTDNNIQNRSGMSR